MNAWNAHTVTNANKTRAIAALLFLTVTPFSTALAQGTVQTAPSFYAVTEFVLQHPRFGNPKASGACGTSTGELTKIVLAALKTNKLPVISIVGAPPPRPNIERVDILPDVVTLQMHPDECVSWISLTVQQRVPLRLDPVPAPREMNIVYWHGGLMAGSTVNSHPNALKDAVTKIGQSLSRQYRADQPPTIADSPLPAED